jgi:hypothetical protein
MTVREFMLKKFPTNEYMDCPVPKHHWETIQEYADKYHEAKVKNLSSNTVLCSSLPSIEKIIKSRIADAFDNGMQNFEKKELLNALDAIKRLIPPSYFEGNGA